MEKLGEGIDSPADVERLTKVAFSFTIRDSSFKRISSGWGCKYVEPDEAYGRHVFCRPRLNAPRGHCPDDVWEVLWSLVPPSSRILDPHLIYTPPTHGTSLRTCLLNCGKHKDSPMVFFVWTKDGDIIGGYAPIVWHLTHKYTNLSVLTHPADDSFMFRKLHTVPSGHDVQVYLWSGNNDMLMQGSETFGLIFGGDGPAITIDRDFKRVATQKSVTFDSPALAQPEDASPGCQMV